MQFGKLKPWVIFNVQRHHNFNCSMDNVLTRALFIEKRTTSSVIRVVVPQNAVVSTFSVE
jgi:hypothetical protein